MTIVRLDDAPVFELSGEGDEAVILTSMPVGTLLIRADGERVALPWSE